MPRACTCAAPVGTLAIVKRPAVSDTAPRFIPETETLMLGSGRPSVDGHLTDDPSASLCRGNGCGREEREDRKENPASHQSFLRE